MALCVWLGWFVNGAHQEFQAFNHFNDLERVLKAVAEQPVAAAGNYFASLRSGSKAGTADMFLDLSTGWL